MATALKKYLPWALLAIVVLTASQYLAHKDDEILASMMADKFMSKVRDRDAKIVAKYAPLIAAKDKELSTLRQGVQVLGSQVAAKQVALRKALAEVATLEGCRASLSEAVSFIDEMQASYTAKLTESDSLWCSKYALLEQRDAERIKTLTSRLGQVALTAIKAQLKNRKRFIVGPQVGYGPGGAYIGAGITLAVWRF